MTTPRVLMLLLALLMLVAPASAMVPPHPQEPSIAPPACALPGGNTTLSPTCAPDVILMAYLEPYISYFEIAEGFVLALVVLFMGPKLRRRVPSLSLTVPKALRWMFLLVAVIGVVVYGFLASMDVGYFLWAWKWVTLPGITFGLLAFVGWVLAVVGFTLFSGRFTRVMVVFGFPSILFLMLELLLHYPWFMAATATMFASGWELYGVYFLSNWTILVASASLEVALLAKLILSRYKLRSYLLFK